MKTIGLLGGMSWESTATYYRLINQGVRERCGGLHSAKMLLYSVDFAEIERLQSQGRWQEAGVLLGEAARRLETAGAELLLICTNTMHKVADQIQSCLDIELLHIADATGRAIVADGLESVGLLGTRFTMEEHFYRCILEERYGLQVSIPASEERAAVDSIIFNELCVGNIRDASRRVYRQVIQNLASLGCQAIILGCTEIPLLLSGDDAGLPLYDTTAIHAEQAVVEMLG
ncbi:MAG: aspartate/glutamate racemase family protein [Desulfocapsaceae bacterium]|jgi:aspartate racemase